jgi:hypothetical protein
VARPGVVGADHLDQAVDPQGEGHDIDGQLDLDHGRMVVLRRAPVRG